MREFLTRTIAGFLISRGRLLQAVFFVVGVASVIVASVGVEHIDFFFILGTAFFAVASILRSHALVKQSSGLELPPGYRAAGLLRLFFGQRAFDRVFGQIFADAHEEWHDAAAKGDHVARRAVLIRTPLVLIVAAAAYPFLWVAKLVSAAKKLLPRD